MILAAVTKFYSSYNTNTRMSINSIKYQPTEQFSSIQSLDQLGYQRGMTDESADILFQSFLQEAIMSSSGMVRDIYLLTVVHPAFPLQIAA